MALTDRDELDSTLADLTATYDDRIADLRQSALDALQAAVAKGNIHATIFVLKQTGGLVGHREPIADDLSDPERLLATIEQEERRSLDELLRVIDRSA